MKKKKSPGTTQKQQRSRDVSRVTTAVTDNGSYLPAEYRAAVAGIPNRRTQIRVERILCEARNIVGESDEDVAKQLAQPAKELHKIACRSSAVRDALVAIVEEAVKPLFFSVLCLAARVVGRLITEDRLDPAQTARAFRGLAAIWFDTNEDRFSWTDDAELEAIFVQMSKDMDLALKHVAEARPELVIDACRCRREQSPETDVSGLCSMVDLLEEAARAGLIDGESEIQSCAKEEAEEDDDEEEEEEDE